MKYCQGPKCHEHRTKDRIRGSKGDKHYETRKRSSFYYLGGNACDMRCQNEWFKLHGQRAVDHFGRIHEPIRLAPENAWIKDYDYNGDGPTRHHFLNKLTTERIPLTLAQYNDNDYTIERARQT